MKLHDFLTSRGKPSATRSVKFRVVGRDERENNVIAEATAELVPLSERERQEALRDAEQAIRDLYGASTPPQDRREDERWYHILFRALRDPDDARQPFADSVKELKQALVLSEATRLWQEYDLFVSEEFPDFVDGETFEKLVGEAKKVSLVDLISSFGFDAVRRSMPGLLAILRTSAPPT